MDEVEPALDDVNLHRFLRLVDGFASASQVLIVTHQKRTMEIAGMMYGISLNNDGTTKVVAQRLENDEVAEAAARIAAERADVGAATAPIFVRSRAGAHGGAERGACESSGELTVP
jgi:hypothetical protein